MKTVASLPGLPDDYASKFFVGDIVKIKTQSDEKAMITRTWADEEDYADIPQAGPFRALLRGEVGVSPTHMQSIMPEKDLELYRRELLRGDVVKESLSHQEAALVLETRTEVQLENVLGERRVIEEWISAERLQDTEVYYAGYQVAFGGWLGVVTLVTTAVFMWNARRKEVYQLYDTTGSAAIGLTALNVKEAIMHRSARAPSFQMVLPEWADPEDQVIRLVPIDARVSWLAINQKLSQAEQADCPLPPTEWQGTDMGKLIRTSQEENERTQLGRLYTFKNPEDQKRYNVLPTGLPEEFGDSCVYRVSHARSFVDLLWQDGRRTQSMSTEVVPHDSVDQIDAFPGQFVTWIDDDRSRRTGIVQTCNAAQQTVELLMQDTSAIETVSVLELDPTTGDDNHGLGVCLGQDVLLCEDNQSPIPHVPLIGQAPDYEGDNIEVLQTLYQTGKKVNFKECNWEPRRPETNDVDWFGEVIGLNKDGTVNVLLANGKTITVNLGQLYKLNTVDEPGEDDELDDESMDEDYGDDDMPMFEDHGMGAMGSLMAYIGTHVGGQFNAHSQRQHMHIARSDASWETTSNEDEDMGSGIDDDQDQHRNNAADSPKTPSRTRKPRSIHEDMDFDSGSDDARAVERAIPLVPPSPMTARILTQPTAPSSASEENGNIAGPSTLAPSKVSGSFEVLETAPPDHQFYYEPAASSGRARMKKLNKEHKSLSTSLPDNVLVRTYEDRMDLMRVLIIGPEGTPYFGAPFVFDIFLHESYPFQPPRVHFHSHTNGKGRCNPNLYEEGKVCLSILGTWMGDASESWDSNRSSLLQVFVSISGLVLVRNPYHCEPAYAKLEGTEEGRVNARLYAEKAYVLSRSFVRQALKLPPPGFENEIRSYYLEKDNIQGVIDHARKLMDKEAGLNKDDEGGARWNADSIGSLTAGAKLSLQRIIENLESTRRDYRET